MLFSSPPPLETPDTQAIFVTLFITATFSPDGTQQVCIRGGSARRSNPLPFYIPDLTHIIQCKRCKKQYIGETKRTLHERFKEQRQATNNSLHAKATAAVPSHLNQPLELQPTLSMSRRKAREAFLIDRGKTLSPDGPNRRNKHCTFSIFIVYLSI